MMKKRRKIPLLAEGSDFFFEKTRRKIPLLAEGSDFFLRKKQGGIVLEKLKILVVDDESRMRKLVNDFLSRQGYEVLEAADGEEALDIYYQEKDIALIILDVMMPKINGWDVCKEIRETSKIPIIMLTAKGDESDELFGFDLGVDEYISKPFSPKILVARVGAILRRSGFEEEDKQTLEINGICVDKLAHIVTVDGERIDLSYKEFELLTFFMENKGIALSREKLLSEVWGYDFYGDARTLDTHVKLLRKSLGVYSKYIVTLRGVGYRFEGEE